MLRGALMISARRAAVVGVMTVAWLSPGRAVMMLLLVSRVKRWGVDAQRSLKVRQHSLHCDELFQSASKVSEEVTAPPARQSYLCHLSLIRS
ncbi:unnamed protein product [Ectocarpus sp. 12 AP-2014]